MKRKSSIEENQEDRRPLALLVVVALLFLAAASRSAGLLSGKPAGPESLPLIVWLEGAVPPGLYRLPADTTLQSLFVQIGMPQPVLPQDGKKTIPQHSAIRLLHDQEPLALPRIPNQAAPVLFMPLGLNTASRQQLTLIPGIGPKLAARIVNFREEHGGRLESLDMLLDVKGIGEKKLVVLKEHLVLE